MRLFVATSNPGKLRDFAHAAAGAEGVQIEPLAGLAGIPAPAEDGLTFEANAREKAVYYSRYAPGELVIADDSGLEVACLDDGPGVLSARFAEDQAQAQNFPAMPASTLDERNNVALLRALDGVPDHCRRGRYRCVLAVARDGEVLATADGALEGRILRAPRGDAGFGYDPLFLLPEIGKTMAEVDMAVRLDVSHRGRALRRLLEGSELASWRVRSD
jgi:XTP/dITP diphosphohydrolase